MSLQRAMAVHRNAGNFEIIRHTISSGEAIGTFVGLPSRWKELVFDQEDSDAKELFFKVWRVCWDVTSCLVPFDSPDLDLRNRMIEIDRDARLYPSMSRQLEDLQNRVGHILENPENPKGEYVFEVINELQAKGQRVGLVARLMRVINPGWQEHFSEIFGSRAPGCELIKTRRELLDSDLDVIILPGSGVKCPFAPGLHGLYRSPVLMVVSYKKEKTFAPKLLDLPPASVNRKMTQEDSGSPIENSDSGSELDDWISNEEWEQYRLQAQRNTFGAGGAEHQFLVRCRLVLLETGGAIYLRDDRKVLEVSALASGEIEVEDMGGQLPRKMPRSLRSGDLIAVRTSGSGDYLEVVADQMLRAEGKEGLRETCTDWKSRLKDALMDHGAPKIAYLMSECGSPVSSPNYIWHWTTNEVIRPQKQDTFASLIKALVALDGRNTGEDIDKYINRKWRQMKTLIKYHLKAGMQIRKALIEQLEHLLGEASTDIGDEIVLTLPDVDAGELTLFKVAAVDMEPSEIPYTKVGVVID